MMRLTLDEHLVRLGGGDRAVDDLAACLGNVNCLHSEW